MQCFLLLLGTLWNTGTCTLDNNELAIASVAASHTMFNNIAVTLNIKH